MSTLKEIPGLEGLYLASSDGRIYSLRKKRWLKLSSDVYGYLRVGITISLRKYKMMKVHRLVAMAFTPNPNIYSQINHINGIKTDNSVDNLEWCNASMNQIHARSIGLSVTTERMRISASNNCKKAGKSNRKLTMEQAEEIRKRTDLSPAILAIQYNISASRIYYIRQGKAYVDR